MNGQPPPALACDAVNKYFDGVHAVRDITFSVAPGEVLGILGPNGSGKTTLINCISGAIDADSGTVRVGAADVTRASMAARAGDGIARTFQNLRLFGSLSVMENLLIGAHLDGRGVRTPWGALRSERRMRTQAEAMIERLDLVEVADRHAGALPYGIQRRVELGRALMSHPSVLLLDEPAAGMNDGEVSRLGRTLRQIATDGVTLVVIEHHVAFMLGLVDRAIVLDAGAMIAEGKPAEVIRRPEVLEAYLG